MIWIFLIGLVSFGAIYGGIWLIGAVIIAAIQVLALIFKILYMLGKGLEMKRQERILKQQEYYRQRYNGSRPVELIERKDGVLVPKNGEW